MQLVAKMPRNTIFSQYRRSIGNTGTTKPCAKLHEHCNALVMLACGAGTSFVVNNEGHLFATGLNNNQQLGLPNMLHVCARKKCTACRKKLSHEYFVDVGSQQTPCREFAAVSSCAENGAALEKNTGNLFTWGNNSAGQIGVGISSETCSMQHVKEYQSEFGDMIAMPEVVQISCGRKHMLVKTRSGRIMTCGNNRFGQLGIGVTRHVVKNSVFFMDLAAMLDSDKVAVLDHVSSIQAGGDVCAVICEDHTLWTWGSDIHHQLGYVIGEVIATNLHTQCVPRVVEITNIDSIIPIPLLVTRISLGSTHTACIGMDRNVYTWGTNTAGKLGNGSRQNTSLPSMACSFRTFGATPKDVCCGGYHTLVMTEKNTLWTCGSGKFGAGHGQGSSCSLLFRQVYLKRSGVKTRVEVAGIAAGKTHSMIITCDDHVMTCGKMKSSMYIDTQNPDLLDTFDGFGGLGYFQGMATAGHVYDFKHVTQLQDCMAFGQQLSRNTRNKFEFFILGIYFDKSNAAHSTDRMYMNLLHCDLIDMIVAQISVSSSLV